MEAVKLVLVFVAIVIAVRREMPVGLVLLGAALLTAVLFGLSAGVVWEGTLDLVRSEPFLNLTGVVVLITVLGVMLTAGGYLDQLYDAVTGLPGGTRTAVMLLPPLIGLMPMPGGSLMSAPLVKKILQPTDTSAELQTLVNYWYRHVAEFFWPIYPGIILTEAMTGLPVAKVSLLQAPLSLAAIVIGIVLYIRRIPSTPRRGHERLVVSLMRVGRSVWPIILAILLYGLLKVPLSAAVALSAAALALVVRPSREIWQACIRKALSYKLLLLVFGVLMFQMVIEKGHVVSFIPALASTYHLPSELIVFLVCFTIGLLTGMVSAYVGLGYALLAGFLYQPSINPPMILMAYVSGFVGVMLSPSHLCLILTNEYFGSRLGAVYRLLAPAIILILGTGLALKLSGWASIF